MKALQELFIESKGSPVLIGAETVIQMDTIPLADGLLTVNLKGQLDGLSGVCFKLPTGQLLLSDGSAVKAVHIWNEANLPAVVTHRVRGAREGVRVWNVYRVTHPNGKMTEDAFTGNAGMVLAQIESRVREYSCSNGPGDFDPKEFVFSIEWEPEIN
jgi:hypothetical protein